MDIFVDYYETFCRSQKLYPLKNKIIPLKKIKSYLLKKS